MSWYISNRPLGSFVVDMGISSNIMKSPSHKCYMIFWDMTIYNDNLHWSDITPVCELITDFDLITKFGGFHRTLQRVRHANRGHLLLQTPGPVSFGTCLCSNVETILSGTCHVYGPFEFRTSLGTSIFLNLRAIPITPSVRSAGVVCLRTGTRLNTLWSDMKSRRLYCSNYTSFLIYPLVLSRFC